MQISAISLIRRYFVFLSILVAPPVRFQAVLKWKNKGKRNKECGTCEIRTRCLKNPAEIELFSPPTRLISHLVCDEKEKKKNNCLTVIDYCIAYPRALLCWYAYFPGFRSLSVLTRVRYIFHQHCFKINEQRTVIHFFAVLVFVVGTYFSILSPLFGHKPATKFSQK